MSGIYIHIPFCSKRCSYCDFFFITNTKLVENFTEALKNEIRLSSVNYKNIKFDSVFFGGGTPSILSANQIESIINEIDKYFSLSTYPEISLESNPEDLQTNNPEDYKSAGINRISFGVQSFIDSELKFLTRQHTSLQASEIIKKASKSFDNINLDIIYSLPGQKTDDIEFSLDKAVMLNANHISAYTLTYEEKTLMYKMLKKNLFEKNTENEEGKFYRFVSDKLISKGYEHYEVSNFAKKGYKCRHNLKYWNYENYLGLGPSSHSLFNFQRWNNVRSVTGYINSLSENILPEEGRYSLSEEQKKLEYVMLSLRSGGVDFKKYKELFNLNFETEFSESISELTKGNFGSMESNKFRLNENGYSIADEIIAKYF